MVEKRSNMEFHPKDFPWGDLSAEITKRVLADHISSEPIGGVEAQRLLRALMDEVESVMSEICARHSKFHLLTGVRDNFSPSMVANNARNPSLSLAPFKYWTLAALKFGHDHLILRALGDWPNDLVRFTTDETRDLLKFVELGHCFADLARIWYVVGNGGSIEVQNSDILLLGDKTTSERRAFHNNRLERNHANMLSPAAIIGPQPELLERGPIRRKMLIASMVVSGTEGRNDPLTFSSPNIHKGATFTIRYMTQHLDLASIYELARPYSTYILREYGLSLDELCCCLECLSIVQMDACARDAGYQAGLLATGMGMFPPNMLKELMRKYIVVCAKHFNIISSLDFLVRRFLDRMVLRDSQLRSLDIHAAWFPSFLYLMGDTIIIDWCAAVYLIPIVLQAASREPEAKNLKGQNFESALGKWITMEAQRVQYLFGPNKKLRSTGRVLAEVDLSFRREQIGFIIDCKAYSTSAELLRGDFDAVNNRWSYAEEWVSDCIKRTRLLAQRSAGDNYRLHESIEYLVPLVCSANVEPIESLEDRYLVAPKLPRVCTPFELVDILNNVSNDDLISNSYTLKVERG